MNHPQILTCNLGGLPLEWVSWEVAATLYAREKVRWEAGEQTITINGGSRSDGRRSQMVINSIIAVEDKSRKFETAPPLTREAIYRRDGLICLYCGSRFPASKLSLDHVVPIAKFGKTTWTNLATCCRSCNQIKGDRLLEECGMKLLAIPYIPDRSAYLMLIASSRRVLSDQQAYLESFANAKAKKPN